MKTLFFRLFFATAAALFLLSASGCARRMTVGTGTTIGLHATPGDGQSQTPQVTLAYKRTELALVPTGEAPAKKVSGANTDAYSSIAVIDFKTKWFGDTAIDQFIATGHASRDIQGPGSEFTKALVDRGSRNYVIQAQIYQALRSRTNADPQAAQAVRDLDALGELVPDEYTWLEPVAIPAPPEAPTVQRRLERPAHRNYTTFTACRMHLIGSTSLLKTYPQLSVREVDHTTNNLAGAELQRELTRTTHTLNALKRRAAESGAVARALDYYIETLKQ